MAKQLAFQQALRQRAAVHRHHWSGTPVARHVQRARRQFLAGPGLAGDQYRGAAARHQADDVLQLPHLVAPAHQHPLPIFRICLSPLVPQSPDGPSSITRSISLKPSSSAGRNWCSPRCARSTASPTEACRVSRQYGNSWSSPLDRFQQCGGPPPGIRKFEHNCRVVGDGQRCRSPLRPADLDIPARRAVRPTGSGSGSALTHRTCDPMLNSLHQSTDCRKTFRAMLINTAGRR